MRYPRLTLASAGPPPLIAVAHGSRDPRAAATVAGLLDVVASRAASVALGGVDVRAAFLDHCAPSLPQVLGALGTDGGDDDDDNDDTGRGKTQSCIVVPLLLTAAYHSKSDIPAQLAAASAALEVECADTLGPHPLLLAAAERRLREAGVAVDDAADRARTGVVLAAAGSSDPAANATIADLAARWQRDRGWRAVVPGYASAAGPSAAEAVAALRAESRPGDPVVVATYLLAPGYFADKIATTALAAGADAVSDALGAAPEVADVVLARYQAARHQPARHQAARHQAANVYRCDRLRPDSGYSGRAAATQR